MSCMRSRGRSNADGWGLGAACSAVLCRACEQMRQGPTARLSRAGRHAALFGHRLATAAMRRCLLPAGALAGGWTHVLAQHARRVIAVDPAALDPRALASPAVTHLACKAEDAVDAIRAMVGEAGVDLLVSGGCQAGREGREGGREAGFGYPLVPLHEERCVYHSTQPWWWICEEGRRGPHAAPGTRPGMQGGVQVELQPEGPAPLPCRCRCEPAPLPGGRHDAPAAAAAAPGRCRHPDSQGDARAGRRCRAPGPTVLTTAQFGISGRRGWCARCCHSRWSRPAAALGWQAACELLWGAHPSRERRGNLAIHSVSCAAWQVTVAERHISPAPQPACSPCSSTESLQAARRSLSGGWLRSWGPSLGACACSGCWPTRSTSRRAWLGRRRRAVSRGGSEASSMPAREWCSICDFK